MPLSIEKIFRREEISRWMGIAVVVVIVGGLLGYYGFRAWQENPEIFKKLPATILEWVKVEEEGEEELALEEIAEESPEIIITEEEKNYIEIAEKGDGITHLARKALKDYLSENPQDFEVTPEHKIYIEDYLAKKKGDDRLTLEEEREFSGDLLQEAIDKSKDLSSEQLENLTQYSQLVPSLNY